MYSYFLPPPPPVCLSVSAAISVRRCPAEPSGYRDDNSAGRKWQHSDFRERLL